MQIQAENNCLEALELKLYERLDELIDANRFADAAQIVELMKEVGIV